MAIGLEGTLEQLGPVAYWHPITIEYRLLYHDCFHPDPVELFEAWVEKQTRLHPETDDREYLDDLIPEYAALRLQEHQNPLWREVDGA